MTSVTTGRPVTIHHHTAHTPHPSRWLTTPFPSGNRQQVLCIEFAFVLCVCFIHTFLQLSCGELALYEAPVLGAVRLDLLLKL